MTWPPAQVSRYRLLRRLGAGGMGEVYLAEALSPLRLKVAVKLLPATAIGDERLRRLFRREARAMAALSHRGVPRVLEFGEVPVPFLVMELLAGATLREVLSARGRLDPVMAAFLASEVARAVGAAHGVRDEDLPAGLVHGDLSPSNVMLCGDGAVKVLDFGLARPAHTERSVSTVEGKLAWLPPEALSGDIGQSADLYAIGVILYELVTGRQPFSGRNDLETVRNVLDGQVTPVRTVAPEVPEALSAIISRAIARDVTARFRSGVELAEALDVVVGGRVTLNDVQHLVSPPPEGEAQLATPAPRAPIESLTAEVPPPRQLPGEALGHVREGLVQESAPAPSRRWLLVSGGGLVLAGLLAALTRSRSVPPVVPVVTASEVPMPPTPPPSDAGEPPAPVTASAPATLVVSVNVDAAIALDGVVVARGARAARLPVPAGGTHRLTVSAPGYRTVQRLVVTSPGAELEVPIALARASRRGPAAASPDDSSPLDPFRSGP